MHFTFRIMYSMLYEIAEMVSIVVVVERERKGESRICSVERNGRFPSYSCPLFVLCYNPDNHKYDVL